MFWSKEIGCKVRYSNVFWFDIFCWPDFDEDDPLAGLLLDEDSVSETARKPIDSSGARKKTVVGQQAPQEEEPKSLQPRTVFNWCDFP